MIYQTAISRPTGISLSAAGPDVVRRSSSGQYRRPEGRRRELQNWFNAHGDKVPRRRQPPPPPPPRASRRRQGNTPYGGKPPSRLPGIVQAENFPDVGLPKASTYLTPQHVGNCGRSGTDRRRGRRISRLLRRGTGADPLGGGGSTSAGRGVGEWLKYHGSRRRDSQLRLQHAPVANLRLGAQVSASRRTVRM
jgi:hypothetical protein